jgi:hypothetical protein
MKLKDAIDPFARDHYDAADEPANRKGGIGPQSTYSFIHGCVSISRAVKKNRCDNEIVAK